MRRAIVDGKEHVFPDDGKVHHVMTHIVLGNGVRRTERHSFHPDGRKSIERHDDPMTDAYNKGWKHTYDTRLQRLEKEYLAHKKHYFKDSHFSKAAELRHKEGTLAQTKVDIKLVEEQLADNLRLSLARKAARSGLTERHPLPTQEPPDMPYTHEVDTKKLATGTRVLFPHPANDSGVAEMIGTVIQGPGSRKETLICADRKDSRHFRHQVEMTGPGHGVLVANEALRPLPDQTSSASFCEVPEHIGVVVRKAFKFDQVLFPAGTTGRLIELDPGKQHVLISWHHLPNPRFYCEEIRDGRALSGSVGYSNCYNVPTKCLQWCRLNGRKEPRTPWTGGLIGTPNYEFKPGDYAIYTGKRTHKVPGKHRYFAVAKGSVVQVLAEPGNQGQIIARLVGGCHEEGISPQVCVDASQIVPLGFPCFERGDRVEITASLEFKKRDLRGKKGTVVLPTDMDGDVGIQFGEDIGGGSLDGHGEDRRCLYVPTEAVQRIPGQKIPG